MPKIVAQCRKPTHSTQHYLNTLPKTYPTLIHRSEDPSRLSDAIPYLNTWGSSPPCFELFHSNSLENGIKFKGVVISKKSEVFSVWLVKFLLQIIVHENLPQYVCEFWNASFVLRTSDALLFIDQTSSFWLVHNLAFSLETPNFFLMESFRTFCEFLLFFRIRLIRVLIYQCVACHA